MESGGARLDLWRLAGVGSWSKSFLFFVLAALGGIWALSSLTRDGTHVLCSGSTDS